MTDHVTTKIPATLDYLVALFRNASTLGAATPPITVIDGPVPNAGSLPLALWVGVEDPTTMENSEPSVAGRSAKTEADYAGGMSENITIPCVAAAWSGADAAGYSALRAAAAGIVQAVETIIVADKTAPAGVSAQPGVNVGEWFQRPLNGLQVFVPFEIAYIAL